MSASELSMRCRSMEPVPLHNLSRPLVDGLATDGIRAAERFIVGSKAVRAWSQQAIAGISGTATRTRSVEGSSLNAPIRINAGVQYQLYPQDEPRGQPVLSQIKLVGGRERHPAGRCLFLYWEQDNLGCIKEVRALEKLFEEHFNFDVKTWAIGGRNPFNELRIQLQTFTKAAKHRDELLIVYYGGHGYIDDRTQQLRWVATNDRNAPELTWNPLQNQCLESLSQDVLIILDTCYAAGAFRGRVPGRKEIIAACGWETQAIGGVEDGTSFTAALMRTLRSFTKPFTIAEAYSELLNNRGKERLARTPIYSPLPGEKKDSIVLTPRPPKPVPQSNSRPATGPASAPATTRAVPRDLSDHQCKERMLHVLIRYGFTAQHAQDLLVPDGLSEQSKRISTYYGCLDCVEALERDGYSRSQAAALVVRSIIHHREGARNPRGVLTRDEQFRKVAKQVERLALNGDNSDEETSDEDESDTE